jgi:hypothetical protein
MGKFEGGNRSRTRSPPLQFSVVLLQAAVTAVKEDPAVCTYKDSNNGNKCKKQSQVLLFN